MKSLVVDASVAVKWFLPEPDSAAAMALLDGAHVLIAPDLIWSEVANIIWKHHRRRELDRDRAFSTLKSFLAVPLKIRNSSALLADALALAIQTDRTAYDCLYVALAVREECVLVSADERLVNALTQVGLGKHVQKLGFSPT
jgi:predicted nucleic acid-binding protein